MSSFVLGVINSQAFQMKSRAEAAGGTRMVGR
jgi:hypothetical protein